MSDQASDFDSSVWRSIQLTLSQKYKALSAKYKPHLVQRLASRTSKSYSVAESESLRWDLLQEDPAEEQERLRVYKINRRKRYLAERHAKGLELVTNVNSNNHTMLEQAISTTYLDMDGPVLSDIIHPLVFNGAADREMVLNCS